MGISTLAFNVRAYWVVDGVKQVQIKQRAMKENHEERKERKRLNPFLSLNCENASQMVRFFFRRGS